jgi:hypothetical protein
MTALIQIMSVRKNLVLPFLKIPLNLGRRETAHELIYVVCRSPIPSPHLYSDQCRDPAHIRSSQVLPPVIDLTCEQNTVKVVAKLAD